jgi:hypothetical protein
VKLLNGNTAPRTRNSDGCTVMACGCAHTEREWLQLCDPHSEEFDALGRAARAAREATANTDWMET